jgi:pyrimidine-nucleoside phosphorylase
LGHAAVVLGAGRDHVDAVIDPGVGIDVLAPEGAPVAAGEPILRVWFRDPGRLSAALARLDDACVIGDDAPAPSPLVLETIQGDSHD